MAQKNRRKKFENMLFSDFSKIFKFHDFWPKNRSKIADFTVFRGFFEKVPRSGFGYLHHSKERREPVRMVYVTSFGQNEKLKYCL